MTIKQATQSASKYSTYCTSIHNITLKQEVVNLKKEFKLSDFEALDIVLRIRKDMSAESIFNKAAKMLDKVLKQNSPPEFKINE